MNAWRSKPVLMDEQDKRIQAFYETQPDEELWRLHRHHEEIVLDASAPSVVQNASSGALYILRHVLAARAERANEVPVSA